MKISIITVCYNSNKTIEKTIQSVLGQDYPDFEYIIIDGGSNDGTIDIVNKYQAKISKFISEPDRGISDAFNKGLKLANGEIIGILNSDDWYEPEILKVVASQLQENKNCDYLVGSQRYWDKNGGHYIARPDSNYAKKIKYMMPRLNHPSSFFRKNVYESIGLFNLSYRYAMDYDLFFRAFLTDKKPLFVDNVITNMNLEGASDTNTVAAYYEVLIIASDKLRAFPFFIYSVFKYYIRQALGYLKLDSLLLNIRKIKYKNRL
jgi:glycosyltransferase involved in cell wall biosynthesis